MSENLLFRKNFSICPSIHSADLPSIHPSIYVSSIFIRIEKKTFFDEKKNQKLPIKITIDKQSKQAAKKLLLMRKFYFS